jgi:hypothetical protein
VYFQAEGGFANPEVHSLEAEGIKYDHVASGEPDLAGKDRFLLRDERKPRQRRVCMTTKSALPAHYEPISPAWERGAPERPTRRHWQNLSKAAISAST